MKKLIQPAILIMLVIATLSFWLSTVKVNRASEELTNLENAVDSIEERVAGGTIHSLVTDPGLYFDVISEHPEWEEIDAVPYSRCYRHLIGTSTYDHIMCMAI